MRYIENNPMYEDHITGLIGASGTHQLTFYWILLVIINLYKQSEIKSKIIPIITGIEVIFMVTISSQNDNTAFFVLFPIIIGQYFLKDILDNKKRAKKIIRFILIAIIIVIGGMYIYKTNDNVNKFVNGKVTTKLEQFGIIKGSNVSVESDEERIGLYKVALEIGNGYGLGCGIGSIQSYGDPSLPMHFGMSEISLRTYEGGIVYLGILILIFTQFLNRILITKKKLRNIMGFIIIGVNITIMAIYTMIFREAFYDLSLGLILCIFNQHYNENLSICNKDVY
ncbi:hypothetical protein GKZ28_10835 [Clostridium chromiireducens]|uniref:O-antigen ligase domain-containing protein n=1 Tax=Clostridium chromiireducens TaxID=225345 RepID=A0A964RMK6_9CLOT|nr:hypothetical protein [Clostridium chromiireducens]MVX64185.1 hypothetical protein [Clostridium chromiireducens]